MKEGTTTQEDRPVKVRMMVMGMLCGVVASMSIATTAMASTHTNGNGAPKVKHHTVKVVSGEYQWCGNSGMTNTVCSDTKPSNGIRIQYPNGDHTKAIQNCGTVEAGVCFLYHISQTTTGFRLYHTVYLEKPSTIDDLQYTY